MRLSWNFFLFELQFSCIICTLGPSVYSCGVKLHFHQGFENIFKFLLLKLMMFFGEVAVIRAGEFLRDSRLLFVCLRDVINNSTSYIFIINFLVPSYLLDVDLFFSDISGAWLCGRWTWQLCYRRRRFNALLLLFRCCAFKYIIS